jgi:hypothetical protein
MFYLNTILVVAMSSWFVCACQENAHKDQSDAPVVERIDSQRKIVHETVGDTVLSQINNAEPVGGLSVDVGITPGQESPFNGSEDPKDTFQEMELFAGYEIISTQGMTVDSNPVAGKEEKEVEIIATKSIHQKPDHSKWDELLKKYVDPAEHKVSYAYLKNDRKQLDDYLAELKKYPVRENWSGKEKMAYWINAYNAFTIALVLEFYPVQSIMDIYEGKAWDQKWINLGDNAYSLNQIENEILRPVYKDPRIHFALNCAAKSCPPLLNGAFTAENLDLLLDRQTKKFINDRDFNQIAAKQALVSRIFEWYADDFGNLVEYLNHYSDFEILNTAEIKFTEYNWSLNE